MQSQAAKHSSLAPGTLFSSFFSDAAHGLPSFSASESESEDVSDAPVFCGLKVGGVLRKSVREIISPLASTNISVLNQGDKNKSTKKKFLNNLKQ